MIDLDIAIAVGERGERARHRAQRLCDAAHDQHGQHQHQHGGHDRGDRHGLHGVRQHCVELRHRNADIKDPDHVAGRILDREIGRHERLAEQRGRPLIGLAAPEQRLARMIGGKLCADGAVAILLLHIGGTADELPACFVIDEQRRIAAEIGHGAIDDCMILELGHRAKFPHA